MQTPVCTQDGSASTQQCRLQLPPAHNDTYSTSGMSCSVNTAVICMQAGLVPGLQPQRKPLASVAPSAAQSMMAAMASRFASSEGGAEVLGITEGGLQQSAAGTAGVASAADKQQRHQAEARTQRLQPRRTVQEWRPAPLLCKRFNVMDPYRGVGAAAACVQVLADAAGG